MEKQEKIREIIRGFNNIKNSIKKLDKYIDIFNKYPEIIRYEFERNNKHITKAEYEANLKEINTMNIDNLIESIDKQINMFTEESNIDKVSNQYITFAFNEIANYNASYCLSDYSITQLNNFEENILQKKDKLYSSEDRNTISNLYNMIHNLCISSINTIFSKISAIEIFDKIKDINNNIVMIGANGSGKSTFSRTLKLELGNNITIIPAQHLLVLKDIENIPINVNMIEEVNKYQQQDKLGSDKNIVNLLSNDFENLIQALFIQQADVSQKYYNTGQKTESILDKTIKIWNELIQHRTIINSKPYDLKIETPEGTTYEFNSLSDGEKAVFYYIGHVLLAKESSYIIVDEPENHLNVSICNKLWDRLEKEREDCKFIYLTHDIDFAISRNDVTLIWNQEFIPPSKWKFEIIDEYYNLPEKLFIELVGSRKKILFCEGDAKNSYDYKLFTILFPNYTVIPVGGHLDVINYCKAYNRKTQLFKNNAIGIIDKDCHEQAQIDSWKKGEIYTININEIENLLCDSIILEEVKERFYIEDEKINSFKEFVVNKLKFDKDQQASWFVKNKINNRIKNNFLTAKDNISSIKEEFCSICDMINIEKIYDERKKVIEEVKDYDDAIKIINLKGQLIGEASKMIEPNYGEKVIKMIRDDEHLQNVIRGKYFSDIQI